MATCPIAQGDFIVEYVGELLEEQEAERREETNPTVYRYFFDVGKQKMW